VSIPGIDLAHAAVQRVDHGMGQPLTLAEAEEQIAHLLNRPRAELGQALAYLACQVVGYRHSQNSDATLAMAQLARIVREYEEKRR
jgi:hypothetical protein